MTEESFKAADRPRRRWLQFSLRTLLLLMVPVACAAAWLGSEYQQCRRLREAIEFIEANGGTITYDDEATQRDWRRRLFGDSCPPVAVKVVIYRSKLSDFSVLAELTELESLELNWTKISDLTPLAGMHKLRVLSLQYTPVSDLTPLAELTQLERLYLSRTRVTDLTPLAGLPNIKRLCLRGTRVDDLTSLAALIHLQALDLSDSRAGNLSPLAGMQELTMLNLRHTRVSDVTPLADLTHLQRLNLRATPEIPHEQIQALRQSLPNCEIGY